jgi:peptidoglycan/xylan/chitin deacetylase (PgdA/CDA1 family)
LVEPALRLTDAGAAGGTRTVAVTLDACPGRFDRRIADMLVARAIPATIFVTAIWMRWNPEALAFLKARPDIFTVENHGAQHLPPVLGDVPLYGIAPAGTMPAIHAEVLDGASAIVQAVGKRPTWYRAAAGIYSPEAIPAIEALGFRIAGYSLNSDEGASLPAAIVAARILAARNGDVIEGHINQPHRESGAGIAAGLAGLQEAGTRFVRLDQLTSA